VKPAVLIISRWIPVLLTFAAGVACHANRLTLMSYNVENLFDDVHDGTEYREFDPQTKAWSPELFQARISTIAQVVRKAVPGGPDIIALQEVENVNALQTLVDGGLKGLGYARMILIPKKGLATNIGIVSRLPVARVHSYAIPVSGGGVTRDIIEAEILVGGHTCHLLDNHWKSKTGGVRETEQSRLRASLTVNGRVRQILSQDPLADIVVAGDMNESVDEFSRAGGVYQTALISEGAAVPSEYSRSSLFLESHAAGTGIREGRLSLYEPWYELAPEARGSYVYGKEWETLDHILISPGMFDGRGFSYVPGSFRVFRESFILTENGFPKGWVGSKAGKGYSDHLPLIIEFEVRE
jgi:endonuclease/exonuclease/phosphatase family metal-dependent hydrolase